MTEKFIYWLENEYDFGKYGKPLKPSSAKMYASGIKSINNRLGLLENDIYHKSNSELIELRDRINKSENKDRKSHFEALIKFREKYEKVEKSKANSSVSRQHDVLKKQKVEQIAINIVKDYFSDLGYSVISREKDNLGWDLEAANDMQTLLIEVKGLSGKDIIFEFTPNEFSKSKEFSDRYVMSVVTNSLEFPVLHNFRFHNKDECWKDRFGNKLIVTKIVGARMSLKK